MMDGLIYGLSFAPTYLNDLIICSSTWEDHMRHLHVIQYDFQVVYSSRKSNENADKLSRILTDDSTHDGVDKKGSGV